MDLLSLLFYVLVTQNVAAWEQMNNAVVNATSNSTSSHAVPCIFSTSTTSSLSTSTGATSATSATSIITTDSSTSTIRSQRNSSSVSSLTRSSRSIDTPISSSDNARTSLLMLTPPSTQPSPHFVNDSFIVFCKTLSAAPIAPPSSPSSDTVASGETPAAAAATAKIVQKEIETKWIDPNGNPRENTKGRVHIEKRTGSLALVFEHMSLDDRGNWTCEAKASDMKERKTFELSVFQKISFDKVEMVQSARDGRDATVYCKVKAEPAPTISWLFNGESITVNNSKKYIPFSEGLVIKDVTQADAGEYTCRAMRITSTFADTDQITILLRIQHKPHWFDNNTSLLQYSYIGGSVNISCDAMGEPPPSFTWLHNGHAIAGKNYRHFYADYGSTLQIHVLNESHFGDYKCKVANPLGTLERIIKLTVGQKPAAPSRFQLKRAFTDGFELDIRSVKLTSVDENMQTFGYRVEYMSEKDLKYSAGNWSYAKRKEYLFHRDGRRFLLSGLKANTTYFMRAASKNLAGISDWSSVKIFATLENFASRSVAAVTRHVIIILALGSIVNSALRHF